MEHFSWLWTCKPKFSQEIVHFPDKCLGSISAIFTISVNPSFHLSHSALHLGTLPPLSESTKIYTKKFTPNSFIMSFLSRICIFWCHPNQYPQCSGNQKMADLWPPSCSSWSCTWRSAPWARGRRWGPCPPRGPAPSPLNTWIIANTRTHSINFVCKILYSRFERSSNIACICLLTESNLQ